jgi:hypothetical protein
MVSNARTGPPASDAPTRSHLVVPPATAARTPLPGGLSSIFAKLDLYPAEEGNRRVLAVLTYLNA